jgi:hypothetical protein
VIRAQIYNVASEEVLFGFGDKKPALRTLELVLLPGNATSEDERPPRLFHPAWMYCRLRNESHESLFIYGPRHPTEATAISTSLFILHPGQSTPSQWDCKGVLIPRDRTAVQGLNIVAGPVALKYHDLRRVTIGIVDGAYQCPRCNGILKTGQTGWPVPVAHYQELLSLPRRWVVV